MTRLHTSAARGYERQRDVQCRIWGIGRSRGNVLRERLCNTSTTLTMDVMQFTGAKALLMTTSGFAV